MPKAIEVVEGASSDHALPPQPPRQAFDLDDAREASPALEHRRLWLAVALIALHAVLAWQRRAPSITTGNDDTTYIMLARSLLHFGYNDTFLIGAPFHSQYPPGYPLLLAMLSVVFGERASVFVTVSVILSAAALALFYLMARRRWPADICLLALAVAAVNPSLIFSAGRVASEPMYMALTMLALYFLTAAPATARSMALGTAAIVAAALTRSIGATLLGALGLLWLLERRYKQVLALGIAGGLTFGAWFLWTIRAPQKIVGRSYIADFTHQGGSPPSVVGVLTDRLVNNAKDYFAHSLPYILPLPTIEDTAIDNGLWLLLDVGLGAIGVWLLWKRHRVAALALASYCALLAIWPWPLGRFLFPMLPLIILALVLGAAWLAARLRAPVFRYFPAVFCAAIIGTAIFRNAQAISDSLACDRAHPLTSPGCFNADQRSLFAAADFARRNLPPSAGILVSKEAPFAYQSGLRTASFLVALRADSSRYLEFLLESGIQYVLLGNLLKGVEPAVGLKLLGVCDHLEVTAEFPPRTNLYRVYEGAAPDGGARACATIRHTLASGQYELPTVR